MEKSQVDILQDKLIKLKKDINEVKKIAGRRPIEKTTFKELYEDVEIPPYIFTTLVYSKFGPELYYDVTEEPQNGRERGKIEKGINKAFAGICAGVLTAFCTPFVALAESIVALPAVGVLGAQSVVYKNYNKNIEKAKDKVKKLENEYNKTLEEFNKAKQQDVSAEL